MPCDVERTGISDRLPAVPHDLGETGIGRGDLRSFHRRSRHQQQVVIREHCVIGEAQGAALVLRLGVKMAAIIPVGIAPEQQTTKRMVGGNSCVRSVAAARVSISEVGYTPVLP